MTKRGGVRWGRDDEEGGGLGMVGRSGRHWCAGIEHGAGSRPIRQAQGRLDAGMTKRGGWGQVVARKTGGSETPPLRKNHARVGGGVRPAGCAEGEIPFDRLRAGSRGTFGMTREDGRVGDAGMTKRGGASWLRGGPLTEFRRRRRILPLPQERVRPPG